MFVGYLIQQLASAVYCTWPWTFTIPLFLLLNIRIYFTSIRRLYIRNFPPFIQSFIILCDNPNSLILVNYICHNRWKSALVCCKTVLKFCYAIKSVKNKIQTYRQKYICHHSHLLFVLLPSFSVPLPGDVSWKVLRINISY